MTAAEKAKELVDKYWIYLRANLLYDEEAKEDAKQCALIAVDEHLKGMSFTFGFIGYESFKFWKDVKTEIEKL